VGSLRRVSIPGWYPDPAGQPNRFRYWFGHQWSEVTTDDPYLPPPPPPGATPPPRPEQSEPEAPRPEPPSPAPSPEQAPSPSGPAAGQGQGRRRGKGLLVAVIAVVLALLLVGGVVGGWLLARGDDGDRTGSPQPTQPSGTDGADEPEEHDAAPPEGEAGPASSCPPGNPVARNRIRSGRVIGGGLSFAVPQGYRPASPVNKLGFEWLFGVSGVERVTESVPGQDYGWVSMLVAGTVEKQDDWTGPEQAALGIAGCMASSPNMYSSHASDRQLGSRATEVDGKDAWEVRHEVRVDDERLRTGGDHVVVVVVDLGGDEERYAVFSAFVPLGDEELRQRLDRAVRTLRVE
jgi:hypothetical protein